MGSSPRPLLIVLVASALLWVEPQPAGAEPPLAWPQPTRGREAKARSGLKTQIKSVGWATAGPMCGAPLPKPPCEGTEHESCQGGRIQVDCCPQGARCNYAFAPFQACGDGACVQGQDPGLCPPREAATQPAADEADCKAKYGSWEPACIAGKVTPACILPVPTNYTGPPPNPPFRTCGDDHCTTSPYIEACTPPRAEGESCLTGWTKVCLMGRLTERCLPFTGARSIASTQIAECGGGRCAIGTGPAACR